MIEEIYSRLGDTYVNFYGAYDFQFKIGSITLEAYMEGGKVDVKPVLPVGYMSILPLARVQLVRRLIPYNGYALVDVQGEAWLKFGIDMAGNFIFDSFTDDIEVMLNNIMLG